MILTSTTTAGTVTTTLDIPEVEVVILWVCLMVLALLGLVFVSVLCDLVRTRKEKSWPAASHRLQHPENPPPNRGDSGSPSPPAS